MDQTTIISTAGEQAIVPFDLAKRLVEMFGITVAPGKSFSKAIKEDNARKFPGMTKSAANDKYYEVVQAAMPKIDALIANANRNSYSYFVPTAPNTYGDFSVRFQAPRKTKTKVSSDSLASASQKFMNEIKEMTGKEATGAELFKFQAEFRANKSAKK